MATAIPAAVGSTPSSELLASSDPAVVSIDSAGRLVGHRNGRALIRSRDGATLSVLVQAISSVEVVPTHLELSEGAHTEVRIVGNRHDLPAGSYEWETTDPGVAGASGTTVQAGFHTGKATLIVRSGAVQAALDVEVRPPMDLALRLVVPAPTLKIGATEQLYVEVPNQIPVEWTSARPEILQALSNGVFYARTVGSTQACATSAGQKSCQTIQVTR